MKHLKIIRMGIFASFLGLLGCGYGNKRATLNESISSYIPVAAQITMDKLPEVLKNVQAGRTEYDFTGRYPNDSHSLRMPKYPKNLSLLSDSQKELLPVSHLSPCIR